MAKGNFTVITGLWKRQKDKSGNEHYYYGKVKATEQIIINPGDELYVFRTSERNAKAGNPSMYLKKKSPVDTKTE